MLLVYLAVSSPYRCVGRQSLHVSLDAAAHNVTLTILLQSLRYRARSRPPSTSPSHRQIHDGSPRNHAYTESSAVGCAIHIAAFLRKESSRLEGLASGLAMSLGNWDP